MRIQDFLLRAKDMLSAVSSTPSLDAEVLLAHVLQKPRSFLLARPEYLLSTAEQKQAGVVLQQRMRGMPIAYITGHTEFFGLDFTVTPNVLVPRPETELFVEAAISLLQNGGTLLDVGTGSGCIAIAVAKHSAASIVATDISAAALDIARQNAASQNVDIIFQISDLLSDIDFTVFTKTPLVITANLPYVPDAERHPSTVCEPESAIFSGVDGLDHFRRFFAQLVNFPFDHCLFEFHPPQKTVLENLLFQLFPHHSIRFAKDHAGLWRLGILQRA